VTAHIMRPRSYHWQQDTADTIDAIPALSRGELLARWEASYGTMPHKMISTRLLVLAAGYEAQADRHRGLAKRTAGQLMRLAETSYELRTGSALSTMSGSQKLGAALRARPRPGMRFLREWNGKSHMVEVVEAGFAWQGKTYRSLSAIATLITGTRWSGPRFFGLTS
jgi:hypothetical protein